MSWVLAVSICAIAVSAMVAVIALRVGAVPGWGAQRWLALAAVAGALYAIVAIPQALPLDALGASGRPLVWLGARAQYLVAGVNVWIWTRYADALLAEPRGRVGTAAARLAVTLGASGLLPGFAIASALRARPPGAASYNDPVPGPAATALGLAIVLCYLPVAARFLRARRAGHARAGLHAAAFLVFPIFGVHDVLVLQLRLAAPYLADFGASVQVAVVGLAMALRLVDEARAAAVLRRDLEARVEERSRALERSHEALHRAEKLAAVGELAASVAHDVNNPAAAALNGVEYLREELASGGSLADAREVLGEVRQSLLRIGDIVRRLLGAGRLATSGAERRAVPVEPLVEEALRLARARCPEAVRLERVPGPPAVALADDGLVVQVLVNLIVNGAQAVPPGRPGRVAVAVAEERGRVTVAVADDGAGMGPDVLARAFEPFFTTKPVGVGTGLGLAICRGLLEAVGGTLRLESEAGRGTRAIVELTAAPRPELGRRLSPAPRARAVGVPPSAPS